MAAQLTLKNPERAYRPGDIISGHVKLHRPLASPCIIVKGIAKSMVRSDGQFDKAHRRGHAILLYEKFPLSSEQREIPFEITIPERAVSVESVPIPPNKNRSYWDYEEKWKEEDPSWKSQHGHLLPPTFMSQGIHPKGFPRAEARVEYSVIVAASTSQGRLIELISFPIWLQMAGVAAREPSSTKALKLLQVRTQKLLPDSSDCRKLSFSQRLKASAVPEAAFDVALTGPEVLGDGPEISLVLDITPSKCMRQRLGEKIKKQVPIPDVYLRNMVVGIKAITGVRAPGVRHMHVDVWSNNYGLHRQHGNEDRSHLAQWLSDELYTHVASSNATIPFWIQKKSNPDPNSSSVDLRRTIAVPLTIPQRLAPTFSTYNIFRTHKLLVQLTFHSAGETLELAFEYPVTIISWPSSAGDGEQNWGPYNLVPEVEQLKLTWGDVAWGLGKRATDLGLSIAGIFL